MMARLADREETFYFPEFQRSIIITIIIFYAMTCSLLCMYRSYCNTVWSCTFSSVADSHFIHLQGVSCPRISTISTEQVSVLLPFGSLLNPRILDRSSDGFIGPEVLELGWKNIDARHDL